MYKLSLKETNDGKWRLELIMPKHIKAIEYDTFEYGVKELKRAYEIRESKDRWPEFIRKAKKIKSSSTANMK